ncbi:hypothetical protein HYU12_03830 [Candidatus Woesearchaeota archaeon]|nr:hypothetical protein [Candidatus Woesearchaeota archaeon]
MKGFLAVVFGLMVAVVMAVSAYAAALPVAVDSVEVDGFSLTEGVTAVRQLERGEQFDVDVKLSATAAAPNVEISAIISGFEHSKSERISDNVRPFDMEAGESVVKTLTLTLPERANKDKYLLRVIVSDRSSNTVVKEFGVKIQPSDSQVVIKDFEVTPEEDVQAGRPVLATVRLKNFGDSSEEDVKVKVSIPELGITPFPAADFIDELDADESVTSDEFFLKLDSCTKPGVYDVVAEVTFDEGDEKVTARKPITVKKGLCEESEAPQQAQVQGKTTIAYSSESQSIVAGGSASYPVTITNSGTSSRAFMLSVDGADWADFRISPSNLITVKAGTTQTAFVSVAARPSAQAGERVFVVSVKDSAGNALQTLALKASVVGAQSSQPAFSGSLRNALTAGLVVAVAVLVIVGLVLAFRRVKGGEEGESQTYY